MYFRSDSLDWLALVRRVLSSASDPTDDLNLIQVDPNQSSVPQSHEISKSSTFGPGLKKPRALLYVFLGGLKV